MKIILFFISFLLFQSLFASDIFEDIDPGNHKDFSGDFSENKWKEELTTLPKLPEEHNLIVFPGMAAYPQYRYAIDEKTLSVGKKDGVVRFVIVISAGSGAENRYYQGINCHEKQIKTYAYAHSSAQQFVANSVPAWKNVSDRGGMGYSKNLAEFYFCNHFGKALTANEIVNNLRYEKKEGQLYYD